MKKPIRTIWIVAILCLLLSACGNVDLGGSAGLGDVPTSTSTSSPLIVPTGTPLATEIPADTPIPPPSGRILFISDRDGNRNLYVMDASGANLTRLTNGNSDDDQPRWSPDGSRVAFASTVNDNTDIYVVNADGTNLTRLTDDPAKDSAPSWSPDGQWLAFESFRDGNFEIYVISVNGGEARRLTNDPAGDSNPQWSPVDNRIAFVSSTQTGNSDIILINADGAGLTALTNDPPPSSDPAWSPDGRQIAYRSSFPGDTKQIWVIGSDGSNARPLTEVGRFGLPAWSRDGRLAFLAAIPSGAGEAIEFQFLNPLDSSFTRRPIKLEVRGDPVWSPNGAYVAFQANTGGNMELFLLAVATGETTQLTASAGYDGGPAWK
ncbi:MAG: DPP IV N-terminal domain-containing protein [Chloroflexota bacterium]